MNYIFFCMEEIINKINFEIEEGEIVGYLGPNGAGKSTTIKMLSGVLVPSSGLVEVAGLNPHLNRIKNAKNIGVVFGQRSQLIWDVPVIDSFMALELGEGSLKDVKGKFYGAKVFEEYTKDQVEEYNKKFPYIPKMRFPGQWE